MTDKYNPLSLFIIDAHPLNILGLHSYFQQEAAQLSQATTHYHELIVKIVGEATQLADWKLFEVLPRTDLLLLDLPIDYSSEELFQLKELREGYPHLKILIFSNHLSPKLLQETFGLGIRGYLEKTSSPTALKKALMAIYWGGYCFSPQIVDLLGLNCTRCQKQGLAAHEFISTLCQKCDYHVEQTLPLHSVNNQTYPGLENLSGRERQVLKMLSEDYHRQDIAFFLNISPRTVDTYRYRLCQKLNQHSLVGLTRLAIKSGLSRLH